MEEIQARGWEVEQEILDVVHKVCVDNGLKYSLFYGSLLGAVRHGGFIPWDDDIDIIMPREDYDKLLKIWKSQVSDDYILQDPYSFPALVNNFTKIRKNNTTFLQFDIERQLAYHKGIFIDIFPMDRLAEGKFQRKIQRMFCFLSLIYNRGHVSVSGGIKGLAEKLLLTIVPKSKYHKIQCWAEKRAIKWNNDKSLKWFGFSTVRAMRHHYNPDIFDELIEVEFQNKKYNAIKEYHQALEVVYGDYMQLPPEEQRVWTHHPLVVDFEHNYEELQ